MNNFGNQKIIETLIFLLDNFKDKKFNFAVVGTTNLIIQGLEIEGNDIDIRATKKDAFRIYDLLKQYGVQDISYSTTEKYRSWFGKLSINGLVVEIIAELEFKNKNNNWVKAESLKKKKFVKYQGYKIPVKSLESEKDFYQQINRERDKEKIKIINKKLSTNKKS